MMCLQNRKTLTILKAKRRKCMTIALSNLCYNCILTEEASSVACNCKKVISLFTSTTTFSRIPITVNV